MPATALAATLPPAWIVASSPNAEPRISAGARAATAECCAVSTQPIASMDLVYVGSVDGTPFFARRSDVGVFQTDLDARLRVTTDITDMLEDAAFRDRYVNEIQTFYIPVEPARDNCVFQPVTSTNVVRRTRG